MHIVSLKVNPKSSIFYPALLLIQYQILWYDFFLQITNLYHPHLHLQCCRDRHYTSLKLILFVVWQEFLSMKINPWVTIKNKKVKSAKRIQRQMRNSSVLSWIPVQSIFLTVLNRWGTKWVFFLLWLSL